MLNFSLYKIIPIADKRAFISSTLKKINSPYTASPSEHCPISLHCLFSKIPWRDVIWPISPLLLLPSSLESTPSQYRNSSHKYHQRSPVVNCQLFFRLGSILQFLHQTLSSFAFQDTTLTWFLATPFSSNFLIFLISPNSKYGRFPKYSPYPSSFSLHSYNEWFHLLHGLKDSWAYNLRLLSWCQKYISKCLLENTG